jgi:fatty-acyl-CoA synthase
MQMDGGVYSLDRLAIVDATHPAADVPHQCARQPGRGVAATVGHREGRPGAILARDGVEHLDCFFACGKIGAIHTALNWRLHWRELAYLIELARPSVLVYSDDFKDNVAALETAIRGTDHAVRHYLHIEGDGIAGSLPFEMTFQAIPRPVLCDRRHRGWPFAVYRGDGLEGNESPPDDRLECV